MMFKTSMMLVLSLLAGCGIGTAEHTPNDNYASVVPQPLDQRLNGFWTAQQESAVISLRIDKDGRGAICLGNEPTPAFFRLKHSNNTFYLSDGRHLVLNEIDDQLVVGFSPQEPIHFYRDAGLKAATMACNQRLQQAYL